MERQEGHLPGFVRRLRFLKVKPQCPHAAGMTSRCFLPFPNDFCRCSRWPQISFSGILMMLERSFAEYVPSSRRAVM